MATLVFVLMVPVSMKVLMDVSPGLVLVLVPVMAVGTSLVGVLVLMLVFVVATHWEFTSFLNSRFKFKPESSCSQDESRPGRRKESFLPRLQSGIMFHTPFAPSP
jgi:hypothetical protein